MDNEYSYLFVRTDLSHAQQIVQTAHAAAIIGEKFHSNTHAVLCGAKDEEHLQAIAAYLDQKGIDHAIFWEPDVAEYTAIATQPLKGSARSPLRKFKLM